MRWLTTARQRLIVTNVAYVVAFAVVLALFRQRELSLLGMAGIDAAVFALVNLGLVVSYGMGDRKSREVFADQTVLVAFGLFSIFTGAYQAITEVLDGTDPTSTLGFMWLVPIFVLVPIGVNVLMSVALPRLLAKR